MGVTSRFSMVTAGVLALAIALPAAAQFSDAYSFLQAVKDRDGEKVMPFINQPGQPVLNTRDPSNGETALHIVVKRRDMTWLGFLLANGAKPDLRDSKGDTPLATAARLGFTEGARLLIEIGASVDAANDSGETPLIIAVQAHDMATVRVLLAGGADPKLSDHIAGMSARDYAARDRRSATILKLIDETPAVKPKKPVQGPKL